MKVKMVKMGSDYTGPINCRLRGIIITEDNKYLLLEISKGNRIKKEYISLSQEEYNKKYPYKEYVYIDFCFRLDIPEDFYNNMSKEYKNYERKCFYNIPYTKDGILKILQKFNKEINDIELVDDYYIDKFREEKGLFELYDSRLKHSNRIMSIEFLPLDSKANSKIKYQYTCIAKNGTEYSKILNCEKNIKDIIKEFGEENVEPLIDEYVKNKVSKFNKLEETYNNLLKEIFNDNKNNLALEIEDNYTDI